MNLSYYPPPPIPPTNNALNPASPSFSATDEWSRNANFRPPGEGTPRGGGGWWGVWRQGEARSAPNK
ncbi:unnamed protein product, partial [Iphiclides podalirius]